MTILGAVQPAITTASKTLTSIPVTIPAIIPVQNLDMIDPVTKKKRSFTIQNAEQLAALIAQGYALFGTPKGSGTQIVYQNPTSSTSLFNNKSLMYGSIAAGLILLVLLFKKK